MHIKVMSDLHFEFHRDGGKSFVEEAYTDKTDVLVIAGDLADFSLLQAAVDAVCAKYEKALVLMVPGNHEFYGSSFAKTFSMLDDLVRRHSNFKVLYNEKLLYNGVKFFGTTLWFKRKYCIEDYYDQINDFYRIEKFEEAVYAHNQTAMDFLWHADLHNSVVITHYLPSEKSVHPNYKTSVMNQFFVCDMDSLMLSKQPKYWIHGHTHKSADYMFGNTRVICNPMGYVRRDHNLDFNYDLILET